MHSQKLEIPFIFVSDIVNERLEYYKGVADFADFQHFSLEYQRPAHPSVTLGRALLYKNI